ncbi:hypothetical protein DPMN_155151 [Dreissena polymorpha]|uniref:Uncharacterized protein n=1 Tax=Dreissena polymorpha TaxID=45954 RepID=A0A9D4J9R6_DREPO|nr:hypothetical protein DPMN_155151 [Dreissena polymorpha]
MRPLYSEAEEGAAEVVEMVARVEKEEKGDCLASTGRMDNKAVQQVAEVVARAVGVGFLGGVGR